MKNKQINSNFINAKRKINYKIMKDNVHYKVHAILISELWQEVFNFNRQEEVSKLDKITKDVRHVCFS